jgi:hypothetical protein
MIFMSDYSDRVSQVARSSTVYGVDSAIVIVVFAAMLFWAAVGTAVWLFL